MAQKEKQHQAIKLVAWPAPQDFQEAMQSPKLSLADPELKDGEVEVNALGLPHPRTGNFASVYHLRSKYGDFAVRCFLNAITDREHRYAEISKFIMNDDLPYTVTFQFLSEGIFVRGSWLPSLKMHWVNGETLDEFIDKHLFDRSRMEELLNDFQHMVIALQKDGIAHGDLQHGNILVTEDGLRLVDYDGMYVPGLSGWASTELGHQNYQHPMRDGSHFGPFLDNFSVAVIQHSLRCLLIDPHLWDELKGGDECLLFRRSDFVNPEQSHAFAVLRAHSSPEIRAIVQDLESLLLKKPEEIALPSPMSEGTVDDCSTLQPIATSKPHTRQRKYERPCSTTPANFYAGEVRYVTNDSNSSHHPQMPSASAIPKLSNKATSGLVYLPFLLVNVVLPFFILATEPKSNKALRFHAWQSLLITGTSFVLNFIWGIASTLSEVFPALQTHAGYFTVAFGLVSLSLFTASIICMLRAFRGKSSKVPILGAIAQRLP